MPQILDDLELWELTSGMEAEPELADLKAITSAEQTAINEWRKKDKKVKKEICLRVSDEYLVYIDQTTTASKLWTGLQTIFQSKAAVSMVNLP